MRFLIDGYNLIFRITTSEKPLQSRRDELIRMLSKRMEPLKDSIILVFDSQHQFSDSSRHHFKKLEICYTDYEETADDYIIKVLLQQQDRSDIIVVTSDLHLAWRARREGVSTLSCEDFLQQLNNRYKNKQIAQLENAKTLIEQSSKSLPKLLPERKIRKNRFLLSKHRSMIII